MPPALSKVFLMRSQKKLAEIGAEEAEGRASTRHVLDGDEAEAVATRHAEERRARREGAGHEAADPEANGS
jgi:hypothetical protein